MIELTSPEGRIAIDPAEIQAVAEVAPPREGSDTPINTRIYMNNEVEYNILESYEMVMRPLRGMIRSRDRRRI